MGSESFSDEAARELLKLRDRLRLLSDVTRRFAEATTDYSRLLDSVAHELALMIRDSCAVFLLDERGETLTAVAIDAADARARQLLRDSIATLRLPLAEHAVMRHVLTSGEPLLVPDMAARSETSRERARWEAELGLHSVLLVPLRVQGRSIGLLTLCRFGTDSPAFVEADRDLAQNLADHAALAIDNARLFAVAEAARRSAEEAQAAVQESEQRLHHTLDDMNEGYTIMGRDLRYLYVNRAGAEQTHLTREQLIGKTPMELYPGFEGTPIHLALRRAAEERVPQRIQEEFLHADGEIGCFELSIEPVPEGLVVLSSDQTERRQIEKRRDSLEAQLRQAQKLEAIGRLASGVAHDFNNLLSIILGYGEDMLSELAPESPMREDLEEIQAAANRAAELTGQLLMFSRQQVLEPKVMSLNDVLDSLERMLERVLGQRLELKILRHPELGNVRADRGSMEQVVINLAVNARDAMPNGGSLTIETANVSVDDEFVRQHLGSKPGEYVFLGVTDTGTGMDAATRAQIFEPFFTTKEHGKGTGLGLSTVFGIVQQAGGGVWVYSELGHGTTFKIYLPRVDAELDVSPSLPTSIGLRGNETILLVEDEQAVREVARRILEKNGYSVLVAQSPEDAVALSELREEPIHLVLTDVIMPRMTGAELSTRLLSRRPSLKVLYMSGYTDGSIASQGVLKGGALFVQKPFTAESLARKVRGVLDGP